MCPPAGEDDDDDYGPYMSGDNNPGGNQQNFDPTNIDNIDVYGRGNANTGAGLTGGAALIGSGSSGGGDDPNNRGSSGSTILPTTKPDMTNLQSIQAWIARNLPTFVANKINDKIATVWRDVTNPVQGLKDVIQSVTGFNVDTGSFNPLTLISSLGTAGLGGAITSIVGGINNLGEMLGIKGPTIDLSKVTDGLGITKTGDGEYSDPTAPNDGSLDPHIGTDGPTTVDENPALPPPNNQLIPHMNSDGVIDEYTVVGSNGTQVNVSPDDLKQWGMSPDQLSTVNLENLITTGQVTPNTTTGQPTSGAPQTLKPGQTIGPDGKPIDTVVVTGKKDDDGGDKGGIIDEGNSSGEATLNPDGSVNLDNVTPGTITVQGAKPPTKTGTQIGGDDTEIPIDQGMGGQVSVETGDPILPTVKPPVPEKPDPNVGDPVITADPTGGQTGGGPGNATTDPKTFAFDPSNFGFYKMPSFSLLDTGFGTTPPQASQPTTLNTGNSNTVGGGDVTVDGPAMSGVK